MHINLSLAKLLWLTSFDTFPSWQYPYIGLSACFPRLSRCAFRVRCFAHSVLFIQVIDCFERMRPALQSTFKHVNEESNPNFTTKINRFRGIHRSGWYVRIRWWAYTTRRNNKQATRLKIVITSYPIFGSSVRLIRSEWQTFGCPTPSMRPFMRRNGGFFHIEL